MRAAIVGGTAYAAGKSVQAGRERESEQQERLDYLEAQQASQSVSQEPAPQPATAGGTDIVEKIQQLQQLRAAGAISETEFAAAKAKLLAA